MRAKTEKTQTGNRKAASSGDVTANKLILLYVVLLGLSMSLIALTVDPYLPAFPDIGQFFGVTNGVVQSTFTGVTLGIAVGQLTIGPLSDAFGRKPLLLAALAGYLLATTSSFFSNNFEVFMLSRMFMGFFAAGGDVVGRAIVRDLYRGRAMQQLLARIYLIQALAPIVGPVLGAQITSNFGWKSIFLVFSLIVLALLFAVAFALPESLPKGLRRSSSIFEMLQGFQRVLADRTFVGSAIYAALQIAGLYAYLAFAPFVYRESFGLSAADIGTWLAINGVFGYVGVQMGSIMGKIIRGQWILVGSGVVGGFIGTFLIVDSSNKFWITQALFSSLLFTFGLGITVVPTLALYAHGAEAGTATSLIGTLNFALASLMSFFFFLFDSSRPAGIGLIVSVLFFSSCFTFCIVSRPWLIPDLRHVENQ